MHTQAQQTKAEESKPMTREQRRSKRKRAVRSRTVNMQRMTKRDIEIARLLNPDVAALQAERPKTRGDCAGVQRPCPWVGCKHNLYLTINPENGSIKLNFPDLEPGDMPARESCVLDIVEDHPDGATLEKVGALSNMTRERIRQIENLAMQEAALELPASLKREFEIEAMAKPKRLPVIAQAGGTGTVTVALLDRIVAVLEDCEDVEEGLTLLDVQERVAEISCSGLARPEHFNAALLTLHASGVIRQAKGIVCLNSDSRERLDALTRQARAA